MPRKTPSNGGLLKAAKDADDWQFLAQEQAAARFGCGVPTIRAMVNFEAAGVLPSFPSIGSRKQVCPELMKRWLLEMSGTEEGRKALSELKTEDRH